MLYVELLNMYVNTETISGSVMPVNATNSMPLSLVDVQTISEVIAHIISVSGCIVHIMLLVFWMNRSMVIESVKSVLKVQPQVDYTTI